MVRVERPDGRQKMGGVAALCAPSCAQTPLPERRDCRLEQQLFNPAGAEARAELAHDRLIDDGMVRWRTGPSYTFRIETPTKSQCTRVDSSLSGVYLDCSERRRR
jgi:hypothetical protein